MNKPLSRLHFPNIFQVFPSPPLSVIETLVKWKERMLKGSPRADLVTLDKSLTLSGLSSLSIYWTKEIRPADC